MCGWCPDGVRMVCGWCPDGVRKMCAHSGLRVEAQKNRSNQFSRSGFLKAMRHLVVERPPMTPRVPYTSQTAYKRLPKVPICTVPKPHINNPHDYEKNGSEATVLRVVY